MGRSLCCWATCWHGGRATEDLRVYVCTSGSFHLLTPVPRPPLLAVPLGLGPIHLQARNRVNQARYRERQNAKNSHIAEQHDAASAELGRARSEHEELSRQNTVLEKMLATRDAAVGILEAAGGGGADSGGGGGGPPPRLQQEEQQQEGGLGQGDEEGWAHKEWVRQGYFPPQLEELVSTSGELSTSEDGSRRSSGILGMASGSSVLSGSGGAGEAAAAGADALPHKQRLREGLEELSDGLMSRLHLPVNTTPEQWTSGLAGEQGGAGPGAPCVPPAALEVARNLRPQLLERLMGQTQEQFLEEWKRFQLETRDILTQYDLAKQDAELVSAGPGAATGQEGCRGVAGLTGAPAPRPALSGLHQQGRSCCALLAGRQGRRGQGLVCRVHSLDCFLPSCRLCSLLRCLLRSG